MTNHELEQRIRTAAEHAAPDCLDKILSSCNQQNTVNSTPVCKAHTEGQMEGAIISMSEMKNKNARYVKMRNSLAAIATAAAALILCFGGYSLLQRNVTSSVDSVVMLDVNPSLSLSVDAGEKVLSLDALNDDAKEVLGSMELKDTSLEVAVNAIIGSMLQKGYLNNSQNTILVSVENEDAARGEALQQKVTETIAGATQNAALDAAVLSQLVSAEDASLEELADQYSVSLGKAALIQEVIIQVPELAFADLAPMTINEIALIAASKNVSSASVTQSGSASDTAFIGQEAALKVSCDHAGVTAEEILKMEVEFDSKKGTLIYEVEFETATKKGEYEIDAATAEILKSELKQSDDAVDDSGYISAAAAKEAALAHAGVTESSTTYVKCYLEYKGGKPANYCVEFKVNRTEYEYEIDLYTGAILKVEKH